MEFTNPSSSIFPAYSLQKSSSQPKVRTKLKYPIAHFSLKLRAWLLFFQPQGETGSLNWLPRKVYFKVSERWRSTRVCTDPDVPNLGGLSLACLSAALVLCQVKLSVAISYFDDIRQVLPGNISQVTQVNLGGSSEKFILYGLGT